MQRTLASTLRVLAPLLAGCVTINVYFPEKELREAAEQIVNEVRPDVVSSAPGEPPPAEQAPSGAAPRSAEPSGGAAEKTSSGLFELFRPRVAHAEEKEKEPKDEPKIRLNVETPVVKKIKETLKKRYPKLVPFYEKGAAGEAADGYLAERDTAALGLKEKRDLQALLKEENDDRRNLYAEIAKANGIDDSHVPAIGKLFSEEWKKKCKPGWWVEVEKGRWERKAERKKK